MAYMNLVSARMIRSSQILELHSPVPRLTSSWRNVPHGLTTRAAVPTGQHCTPTEISNGLVHNVNFKAAPSSRLHFSRSVADDSSRQEWRRGKPRNHTFVYMKASQSEMTLLIADGRKLGSIGWLLNELAVGLSSYFRKPFGVHGGFAEAPRANEDRSRSKWRLLRSSVTNCNDGRWKWHKSWLMRDGQMVSI